MHRILDGMIKIRAFLRNIGIIRRFLNMPLPFLKPKAVAGVIISQRKPDGSNESTGMEGDEDAGLNASAADLIRAIHAKDEARVAAAFRAAFQILESEPHEESTEENEQPSEFTGE